MRFRCQPRSRGTWDKVQKSGPRGSARRFTVFYLAYACGELIFPLGEATGVHGLPGVGLIPGLPGEVPPLLFSLPGLDGFELDDPECGEEPDVPLVVPGTTNGTSGSSPNSGSSSSNPSNPGSENNNGGTSPGNPGMSPTPGNPCTPVASPSGNTSSPHA